MTTQMEMPKYVSHKTVWALKIKSIASEEVTVLTFDNPAYAPKIVSEAYERNTTQRQGAITWCTPMVTNRIALQKHLKMATR